MDNLSFTTFLKISLLPTTLGKVAAIQKLFGPDGGYDFYKRMKLAAYQVALGETSPQEILDALSSIKRPAERNHNLLVAKAFVEWWTSLQDCVVADTCPGQTFNSDNLKFGVRLRPELSYNQANVLHVTYLWATQNPKLTPQMAGAGIVMLKSVLAKEKFSEAKFQILDLRRKKVFGEECITNQSSILLQADLALINSIWPAELPKAA